MFNDSTTLTASSILGMQSCAPPLFPATTGLGITIKKSKKYGPAQSRSADLQFIRLTL